MWLLHVMHHIVASIMHPVTPVLDTLENCQISTVDFIVALLTEPEYENQPIVLNLLMNTTTIFNAFMQDPATHNMIKEQCFIVAKDIYVQELQNLVSEDSSSHFGAAQFSSSRSSALMIWPAQWKAVHPGCGTCLNAYSRRNNITNQGWRCPGAWKMSIRIVRSCLQITPIPFGMKLRKLILKGWLIKSQEKGNQPSLVEEKHTRWRSAIRAMVSHAVDLHTSLVPKTYQKMTVVCSILMQGINQKFNTLQSIVRFFLQLVHAPYNLINTLTHIGLSISTNAKNIVLPSLSMESEHILQTLGHELITSYTYDNFDVNLKSHVPTIEKLNDSLKHLTSGLLFPLVHRVVSDDLQCLDKLWKKSLLNPDLDVSRHKAHTWWNFISLLCARVEPTNAEPSPLHKFNTWMFLHDLCTHGPVYFHQFKPMITHLQSAEQISLVKMPIFAAQAININNSTVSRNICAIIKLLKQGRIHKFAQIPSEDENKDGLMNWDSLDISEHVILICGDLGTGEQLYSTAAHKNESYLMNNMAVFCPCKTFTFASTPGFVKCISS